MTPNEILSDIERICKKHNVKKAILFGSRALGTAHETSDFDIAVSGVDDFYKLEEEIQDIPTLYSFDVVNLDTCKNELLIGDIQKYGKNILH